MYLHRRRNGMNVVFRKVKTLWTYILDSLWPTENLFFWFCFVRRLKCCGQKYLQSGNFDYADLYSNGLFSVSQTNSMASLPHKIDCFKEVRSFSDLVSCPDECSAGLLFCSFVSSSTPLFCDPSFCWLCVQPMRTIEAVKMNSPPLWHSAVLKAGQQTNHGSMREG